MKGVGKARGIGFQEGTREWQDGWDFCRSGECLEHNP